MNKICTKCNLEKPITEFFKDKQKASGYRPDCKICNIKRSTLYAKKNRKQTNFNNLKHSTGVDKNTYLKLLNLQNNVCAICDSPNVTNFQKTLSNGEYNMSVPQRGMKELLQAADKILQEEKDKENEAKKTITDITPIEETKNDSSNTDESSS